MIVTIGVSARHVHVNRKVLDVIYGEGYELTKIKSLNQPMQYAAMETVTIETEKGKIDNVRILGPVRDYTQVEISKTDAFKLGINPPIRDSGDIKGSSPITIIGPRGKVRLKEGCIIPTRHIHITKEEAKRRGLLKKEVMVMVNGPKGAILGHVQIKVSDIAHYELHLDTDDANALLVRDGDEGVIIK